MLARSLRPAYATAGWCTRARDRLKTHLSTAYFFYHCRYQRSRKATLSVELRQVDRTTDLPIYDYSDTRLTLALSSSF